MLGTFISFFGLIFAIPTPRVLDRDNFINSLDLSDRERQEALPQILESFDMNQVSDNYYFEQNLDRKRNSAVFLAVIFSFSAIFISTILFFNKSHIAFPVIAAIVISIYGYLTLLLESAFISIYRICAAIIPELEHFSF